jgi:(p)ppGpp synthase/HD superfamily hydrolase
MEDKQKYDKDRHSRVDLSFHNAIVFAARKHDKQYRKSTDIPYIAHLMEVMQILFENNCEEEVNIAGILHDTLEDTNTTKDEIRSQKKKNVLSIVQSETEDKTKIWKERKQATIDHLPSASKEAKLVCCADKLSNMRSIYADLEDIGEKLWERFNADKKSLQWYYKNILLAISEISDSDMYYDLSELVKDVFHLEWNCNKDE